MSNVKKCKPPINLGNWIAKNASDFKPPVGNKYLYDGDDFFVMVIGGPNARNDFHVTNSEEYFYQLKGDIVVSVVEDKVVKHVPIKEGETFFIPGGVPHAPVRPPNTVGVVVERRRPPGETERQQFYCPNCHFLVLDNEFDCGDIVNHFKDAMELFWSDEKLSTCVKCGTRILKPNPVSEIIFEPEIKIVRQK